MNDQNTTLPTSFWVISVIALVWNIMGVYSFYIQTFISESQLDAMTAEQIAVYESFPSWIYWIFGVAVFGGLLGSIGLLMKKGWCKPLFVISLVAIIIQMGYAFLLTDHMEVYGPSSLIVPLAIIAVAAFLVYYSKQCAEKGWLT